MVALISSPSPCSPPPFSLQAIYFEFIDADVIPSPSNSDLPRLSIWTTSLVSKIETMDCVCKANSQYGRLPLKDVSDTIFGYIYKKGQQMDGKSYKDLMNFVLSICPENHHTVVKQQLPLIMVNMRNEIVQSIEPIFVENILKVMSMLQVSKSMDGNNNPSSFKTREVLSNEPLPIEHPYCFQLNSKFCASGVNSTPRPLYLESSNALVVADCSKQGNNKDDSSTIRETHGKDKEVVDKDSLAMVISNDSLIMQKEEGVANHLLLLPVPSNELLDSLNEEAYSKWRSSFTQSLIDSLKSIQVSSEIDLPYNLELIESMYPKKDDTASFDEYIYSTTDIISYVLEEVEAHRKVPFLGNATGLLPTGHWKRYYYEFDIAALFQKPYENPGKLSNQLSNGMIGFMLDTMDLVHLPLFTDGFYFLLTVNFRQKLFEVLYPNTKFHLICDHANVAIKNFKMAFKIAYKHSHVDIQSMESVFRSVCSSQKDSDSGIFVMELIRNQKDGNILCFEPNHAKPLRESLTYYMLAHPFNEKMPPETKNILKKHTEGYYPWMHEQCETSTQDPIDPIERMVLF